jgi:regulator of protease activity HflC (stomatin/prohibitin superfamily)
VAEQNVLTQQYNLAAEQYVANKTIVQMEAEAAAILINATAQRNATIVRSEGLAEAISIVMAHLNSTYGNQTRDYLQWVYMQALTDPNTSITYVILPSDGGVPILLDVE